MRRCKQCLLPEAVPDAGLDDNDICRPCREYQPGVATDAESERADREADLEKALEACRGQGKYDCLVPFSGGKDSALLLYKLVKEYDMNVLAFTVDVNIPDIAWQNIRRTNETLGIDHLSYSPPSGFYKKLFKYLLSNQEERGATYTVSYVYAPLFEGDAIKLAMDMDIPLVLAGYSPGQPEPERMLYEFSRNLIENTDWTPPELASCGQFSEAELGRFFNPADFPAGTQFPRYLAPFHAWEYNQDDAMRIVVEQKLIDSTKKASPIFSNYPINWLLMYSDLKHFGYNPYAPEFCDLIREGKAKLSHWKLLGPFVDFMIRKRVLLGANTTSQLKMIGMDINDLRINKPKGAYDPVF